MIYSLGVLFLVIIFTLPFILIDFYLGDGFLHYFITKDALTVMATLLGLNLAAISFLVGNLNTIENKLNTKIFINTKKELKHNIIFMLFAFILFFLISLMVPIEIKTNNFTICPKIIKLLSYFNLYLFFLSLYCIYETISSIFKLDMFDE